MLPKDDRVSENRMELDIVQRVAAKLRGLDAPRAPQGGLRVEAEALGLATDAREWRRGGTPPALATERPQPTPIGQDAMDVPLERAGGFHLRRGRPYTLQEASSRLQRAFGDDTTLKLAGKARLSALNLLQDDRKPSAVPEEIKRLKETIQRDQAEQATLNRRPSLQERLKALKTQLDQLLQDEGDDEDADAPGDWRDPRSQDLRASAEDFSAISENSRPRTNRRGVLIDAAGEPLTLRSQPD
jgi:hypothetical protein